MKKKYLPFLIIGVSILLFFTIVAIFPQLFTSYDRKMSFGPWLSPSKEHLLGTNSLGYDIWTELIYGTKDTMLVGILSSILTIVIGLVVGILAAQKGIIGAIFNGLINIFVLIPKLITLIVLAAFIGSSNLNLIILIALFPWVGLARSVRAKIIHMKTEPFIEVCSLYGYSKYHTVIHHILPNLKDIILSKFLLSITGCIMMESTLSFLGFGNIYYPTWGVMINFARSKGALIRGAYNYLLSPCICIMLLSLSFYFISLYIDAKSSTIQEI